MSFAAQLPPSQDRHYAWFGDAAVFTPQGGSAKDVVVIVDAEAADADAGGLLRERPAPTPAYSVRIRASELEAQGLMQDDPAARARMPVWKGATITLGDEVARAVAGRPRLPKGDVRRTEWIFDLA